MSGESIDGPTPGRDEKRLRRIRSFVRRPGRLTPAQKAALEELGPRYALPDDCRNLADAFERKVPLVVEIGCGNGQALIAMAEREPEKNFVGIEVHEPGVGRLLQGLAEKGLDNVRVVMADAVDVLARHATPGSIDEVRIYFPDPWPKKRHHKRRLIQPEFVGQLALYIRPGGLLHLATDWQPYCEWMLEVIDAEEGFVRLDHPLTERPEWRPRTHFETRGARKGHAIADLLYRRAGR